MKKNLVIIMLMSLTLHGCDIYGCSDSYVYLYKFEEEDYANNVCVDFLGSMVPYVPCKLHNGYYYGGSVGYPIPVEETCIGYDYGKWSWVWDVYYLSFTYDDINAGRAPSDWLENWRNYVIAHTPYAEVYAGPWNCTGGPASKREKMKFRGTDTTLRKHSYFILDTTKVNKIIDKGQMDELFTKLNVTKTPDSL